MQEHNTYINPTKSICFFVTYDLHGYVIIYTTTQKLCRTVISEV